MAPLPLTAIPTLAQLYAESFLQPSATPEPTSTSQFTTKISLIRTDITTLAVDSIVNAANTSLLGGGGVDGAIHRAAGPDLFDECETLEGCDTGSAKITNAYQLPCKKVIHAVGPVYYSAKREGTHKTLLQSCYTMSLDLAVENGCRSIAFSALSTGVYGYPSFEAAEGAIEAVKDWLEEDAERAKKMDRIIFCQFMEKDQMAYEKIIPRYFTPMTEGHGQQKEAVTKDVEEDTPQKVEQEDATVNAEKKDPEGTTTDVPSDSTILASASQKHAHEEPKTPANKKDDEEATPSTTDTLPDLPDVPTKEPALPGEPEVKKLKLSQ